ncbi:MAG: alpha/beta hydrolase [Bdellovibrionaceae bacterium]|nr:alpha/beta hydrolase [Pseudobdellovibrionaceae bacterium]
MAYIPGFSATRMEMSPVFETVARDLNMNLYMGRLSGHGQTAEEFSNIRAEDFINDGRLTLGVLRTLGHKLILAGTSTGALLAIRTALENPERIEGLVLSSPAFDLMARGSRLLSGIFGERIVAFAVGPYRVWSPQNEEQEKYWHTKYRSEALVALGRNV